MIAADSVEKRRRIIDWIGALQNFTVASQLAGYCRL